MVAFVVTAWLVVVVVAWALQTRMIYLPDTAPPRPVVHGPELIEVDYDTADGLRLDAWFVPHPDPVSTVVVANGNAGNRAVRWPLAVALHDRGHAVLLTDYRGYGGNPGRPDHDGVLADLAAADAWVRAHDDVDPDRVVYLGESLGSAVAARLAASQEPAALVLRSPFPSLVEVARRHYPFLPVNTLLRERHDTLSPLESFDGPVLVVAGGRDRIVPTGLSRAVANASGAEYLELGEAGHNDRALLDGDRFVDEVDRFVRRHLGAD